MLDNISSEEGAKMMMALRSITTDPFSLETSINKWDGYSSNNKMKVVLAYDIIFRDELSEEEVSGKIKTLADLIKSSG